MKALSYWAALAHTAGECPGSRPCYTCTDFLFPQWRSQHKRRSGGRITSTCWERVGVACTCPDKDRKAQFSGNLLTTLADLWKPSLSDAPLFCRFCMVCVWILYSILWIYLAWLLIQHSNWGVKTLYSQGTGHRFPTVVSQSSFPTRSPKSGDQKSLVIWGLPEPEIIPQGRGSVPLRWSSFSLAK